MPSSLASSASESVPFKPRISTRALRDRRPAGRGHGTGWILAGSKVREASTQPQDRGGVNLRNARFDHAQDEADLLHGGFFVVVEGHDEPLALGQLTDGLNKALAHFRVEIAKERI